MSEGHGNFLADPHTWILFSAVVFAAVAWKKGKAPLLKMLDGRTARIKSELEEAERLKNEAQALLADYQQKHRDAVQTAQDIIEAAEEAVTDIYREADLKLTEKIKRHEEMLMDRIARAEAAAVNALRNQAADIAAAASEKLLADALAKRGPKLVDEAIEELPKRMVG